jgi:choloylglycine hydrolase
MNGNLKSFTFTFTFTLALIEILWVGGIPAGACTSFQIKTQDGYVFYARTMEYGLAMESNVVIVPRGTQYQGTLPDGTSKGVSWAVKYGFVGMNSAESVSTIVDGINEKGLAVGGLLFPGFAEYETFDPALAGKTLAQYELITWIVSNFATVEEVRQGVKDIRVCRSQAKNFGVVPLHYVVHDRTGECIVLEYVKGKMTLYENPFGVMTNSPPFDWMMIYLRNFVNLSAVNVPELKLDGVAIKGLGQGTGMLGLPGDFTPPSRFIRMIALTQSVLPVKGPEAGLNLAITVINNVDIPIGAVREEVGKKVAYELTQWTLVSDLGRNRLYFNTYDNKNWRYVDLSKALEGAKDIRVVRIKVPVDYPDVTPKNPEP